MTSGEDGGRGGVGSKVFGAYSMISSPIPIAPTPR